MEDETILQLARTPSTREEGFRQLVLTYQQRLYQVIRRQLPSHEDADDVLQNTLLKVFRHLENFEGRSGLFTWMYRIAQNEVINHHKRNTRIRMVELDQRLDSPAEVFVDMENVREHLEQVVSTLPGRQQMVFRMRYFEEMSYREMAEILQLTEGALKASFHHAIKKIEDEFRQRNLF